MTSDLEEMKRVAVRVLGHEGRMMAHSKSGYHEARPTNIGVFNSRIVVPNGAAFENLWSGDLDLTLWEERLAVLARLLDLPLRLLYERNARDAYEGDPVESALAAVTASGKVSIGERNRSHIVRSDDGTLRLQIPPDHHRRWSWRLLLHRPRLWRFWIVELRRREQRQADHERTARLHIGARDRGTSPLLVLGWTQRQAAYESLRTIEWTWYPSGGEKRRAAKSLLHVAPRMKVGRWHCWLRIVVWPGMMYVAFGGLGHRTAE